MTPDEDITAEQERVFHATAGRNVLGGYTGCFGPECNALVDTIRRENFGDKIASFPADTPPWVAQ